MILKNVAVIIPAVNEEATIGKVVNAINRNGNSIFRPERLVWELFKVANYNMT